MIMKVTPRDVEARLYFSAASGASASNICCANTSSYPTHQVEARLCRFHITGYKLSTPKNVAPLPHCAHLTTSYL